MEHTHLLHQDQQVLPAKVVCVPLFPHLATGPDGTTVIIEMKLCPTAKLPVEIVLPDTW